MFDFRQMMLALLDQLREDLIHCPEHGCHVVVEGVRDALAKIDQPEVAEAPDMPAAVNQQIDLARDEMQRHYDAAHPDKADRFRQNRLDLDLGLPWADGSTGGNSR